MQPKRLLATFAMRVWGHVAASYSICHLPGIPRSLSAKLLPSQLTPLCADFSPCAGACIYLYWTSWGFFLAISPTMSRSLWMLGQPLGVSVTPFSFVSSENLLRVRELTLLYCEGHRSQTHYCIQCWALGHVWSLACSQTAWHWSQPFGHSLIASFQSVSPSTYPAL